jgi:hypothetical protein
MFLLATRALGRPARSLPVGIMKKAKSRTGNRSGPTSGSIAGYTFAQLTGLSHF